MNQAIISQIGEIELLKKDCIALENERDEKLRMVNTAHAFILCKGLEKEFEAFVKEANECKDPFEMCAEVFFKYFD